jgi:hypothetical protein
MLDNVVELTPAEGRDLFARACLRVLNMSSGDFLHLYNTGRINDLYDYEDYAELVILIPFWKEDNEI